jgi:hypothetical protein
VSRIRQFRRVDYEAVAEVWRVNLLVLPDNEAGLRFWQKLGYLPCPDVLCTKPLPAGPSSWDAGLLDQDLGEQHRDQARGDDAEQAHPQTGLVGEQPDQRR